MNAQPYICDICAHVVAGSPQILNLRELSADTGERFDYAQCPHCGAARILNPPDDEAARYGEDYYSMRSSRKQQIVEDIIFRLFTMFKFDWHRQFTPLNYLPKPAATAGTILDIGCGQGLLIRRLNRHYGYRCTGIDPFLAPAAEVRETTLQILRQTAQEATGTYDFVMLNHSIEHAHAPYDLLKNATRLLAPGGHILLRLPISPNYLTQQYGEAWRGYDPPDHRTQFTQKSLELLAARCNLKIVRTTYEATPIIAAVTRQIATGKCFNQLRLKNLRPTLAEIRHANAANRHANADLIALILEKK